MLFCSLSHSCQSQLLHRFYHYYFSTMPVNNLPVNKCRVNAQNCFLCSFQCSRQKCLIITTLRNYFQLNDQSSLGNMQQAMNFPSGPYVLIFPDTNDI